jgi:hypothetical protein
MRLSLYFWNENEENCLCSGGLSNIVFYVGLPEGTEPLGREPASILLRYARFYVGLPEGTEPERREAGSIFLRFSLRATWGFLKEQKLRNGTSQYFSQVFTKG